MVNRSMIRRLVSCGGVVILVLPVSWCPGTIALGQGHAWQDDAFEFRRTVRLPEQTAPSVVVCEFLTHGQITGPQPQLAVYGHKEVRPHRVLQVGPEDFCRLAFQTNRQDDQYYIYYGTQKNVTVATPPWDAKHGLLLETRRWRNCDLSKLDAVRSAFRAAEPLGSDYVPQVFHSHNPFDVAPAPFLSRFEGTLQVPVRDKYEFFTSSQDCSFLLIDGQQVVAAPGRHGPVRRARIKGEITLDKGDHQFEYWHAAAGDAATMVAAWLVPGANRPELIPPQAFGNAEISHVAVSLLQHRKAGVTADFRLAVQGDVLLEQNDQWMVRVQLSDATDPRFSNNAKFHWEFGDGQTSDQQHPTHVYLHPGRYRVVLSVRRRTKTRETANWVHVRRPTILTGQKPNADKLEEYLPLLAKYNSHTLDPAGLVQLVRAFIQAGELRKAVQAGAVALAADAATHGDASRWDLVRLLGPLLRDRLDDPEAALKVWLAGGKLIGRQEWRARCALEAVDICLHDLLRDKQVESLLRFASEHLKDADRETAGRRYILRGDSYTRQGNSTAAREAYKKAAQLHGRRGKTIEQNAWRGARSRSTEAFLRDGELARARDELRQWELDFPMDKVEGYLSLLWARYWVAHQKYAQAVAVGNDLLTVNPRSSYADQLLWIVAESEAKLGNVEQARAACQSLLTDYPGSPLVPQARDRLDALR